MAPAQHRLAEPEGRLRSLDALRGIALCGILLVNLPYMGWLIEASTFKLGDLGSRGWNASATVLWVQFLFVLGTMRGLFSMLFGAGIILFLAKNERAGDGPARANGLMVRRLGWLAVFGVVDATILLWPGDILVVYALAGFLIMPLWRASPKRLAAAALVAVLAIGLGAAAAQLPKQTTLAQGPTLDAEARSGAQLTEAQRTDLDQWRHWRAGMPDDPADIARERDIRLGGYWDNLRFMTRTSWDWFWDPETPIWILDAAAFMLVGMLLFRAGWLQGNAPPKVYLLLLIVGYGLGVPLKSVETIAHWRMIAGAGEPQFWQFIAPALTMQPARLLVTLGHLGAFHLLWRVFRRPFRPLEALGRMALTGYLLQSVLAALAFSGFGLGLWGRFDLAELWVGAAAIWAIEIALAVLWLSRFRLGPMEWVWRRLIYGRAGLPVRASPLDAKGPAERVI